MTSTTRNGTRIVETVGLAALSLITFLTALVIGWFEVWFQLFGDRADRSDYATAAGAYGAGTALLLLVPVIVVLLRVPLLAALPGLAGAAVLGCLAVSSAGHVATAEPSGYGQALWTDGATTMAWLPWNWALPALLVLAVVARLRSTSAPTGADRGRIDAPYGGSSR